MYIYIERERERLFMGGPPGRPDRNHNSNNTSND